MHRRPSARITAAALVVWVGLSTAMPLAAAQPRPAPCAAVADILVRFDGRDRPIISVRGGGPGLPLAATADVRWRDGGSRRAALRRAARSLSGAVVTWRILPVPGGGDRGARAARAAVRAGDPRAAIRNRPGCPVGARTPAADGRWRFGLSVGGRIPSGPSPALDRWMADLARLGVRALRFDVAWPWVQPRGPGSYDWRDVDAVADAASKHDVRLLAMVGYTPTWAARPEDVGVAGARPASPDAFARFAGAAARRLAARGVHDFEVWNEPNIERFWRDPNPDDYAVLLRAASAAIHGADPLARVVSAGLAPAPDGPGSRTPVAFLDGIYAAGARAAFDAVGFHPYTAPDRPSGIHPLNAWHQMSGTSESVRSVMVRYGDARKPVWLTEFGAATDGGERRSVSEAEQAMQLHEAYDLASREPWIGPLYWYELRDNTPDGTAEAHFGLRRLDGSPKPALAAYRQRAARGR